LPRKQRFIEDAYLTDRSQCQQTKVFFFSQKIQKSSANKSNNCRYEKESEKTTHLEAKTNCHISVVAMLRRN
jgi:hypothetical protein